MADRLLASVLIDFVAPFQGAVVSEVSTGTASRMSLPGVKAPNDSMRPARRPV